MSDKLLAKLSINDLPSLSDDQVAGIANWLQDFADELRTQKQIEYAEKFTARFWSTDGIASDVVNVTHVPTKV